MMLKIRGWKKFQHFKDRLPPWIKLYRDLLDDPDWHALDPVAAKTLTMLWLLASEDKSREGAIPDLRKAAFRLRLSEDELSAILERLSDWIEWVDITPISPGYQDAPPEAEAESVLPLLISTMADLKFEHAQIHRPKVIAMIAKWQKLGADPEDITAVVLTIRERQPGEKYGPAYFDKPVLEYLEAKRNGNTSGWRSGQKRAGQSEDERFHEFNKAVATGQLDS